MIHVTFRKKRVNASFSSAASANFCLEWALTRRKMVEQAIFAEKGSAREKSAVPFFQNNGERELARPGPTEYSIKRTAAITDRGGWITPKGRRFFNTIDAGG